MHGLIDEIRNLHDRRADACARARPIRQELDGLLDTALRAKIEMDRLARKLAVEREDEEARSAVLVG